MVDTSNSIEVDGENVAFSPYRLPVVGLSFVDVVSSSIGNVVPRPLAGDVFQFLHMDDAAFEVISVNFEEVLLEV